MHARHDAGWRATALAAALMMLLIAHPGSAQERRLTADLHLLRQFSRELADMEQEMGGLQRSVGLKQRGFYTQDEHAAIERLLFRYLMCRDALWEIVDAYRDDNASIRMDSAAQAKGVVLGVNAALKLAYYSSKLVDTFLDEPEVIAKLNEAYHRYDIPANTYDRLFDGVTDVDHIRDLRAAWELFRDDAGNPATRLYAVSISDPRYRELIRENYVFYSGADATIRRIIGAKALFLPDVRNQLRHSEIMDTVMRSKLAFDDNLYAVRGLLFSQVGRLRRPGNAELHLSPGQIDRVRRLLRPGDILLTFSSGYMSNVFLPGVFKHGITYVGSLEERREEGLTAEAFSDLPEQKRRQLLPHLARSHLESGARADLVEAVAEGVIFNSLDRILDGPVHRVVALRPRLLPEERKAALKSVFLFVGADYDFRFDFNDASYLCCTEVIYRAFHKRGPIRWQLVPRMGKPTLSADDIARSCLTPERAPFACVAVIQPDGGGAADILSGPAGERAFRTLMATE